MGIQGLWTVMQECEAASTMWQPHLHNRIPNQQRDTILVDFSAVEYMLLYLPLHINVLCVGNHLEHARACHAWLSYWLEHGFRVVLVLDGGFQPSHSPEFVRRRQSMSLQPEDPNPAKLKEDLQEWLATGEGELSIPWPPLFDELIAGVLAELRARFGPRLVAVTAIADADRVLVAWYRKEEARIAALITPDSDFFAFGVERILQCHQTDVLFDVGGTGGKVPAPTFKVHLASRFGRAVLQYAREQLRRSIRRDFSFQLPGMTAETALIAAVPPAMLFDIAACLGTDLSKHVRTACNAIQAGPWLVIRRMLATVAPQRGWVDIEGRATQRLFNDANLGSVCKHWAEYVEARSEYAAARLPALADLLARPEQYRRSAGPLGSGPRLATPPEAERFVRALCSYPQGDGEVWVPRVLLEWVFCGLGVSPRAGCSKGLLEKLRPLRVAVLRCLASLVQLPEGWLLSELSWDWTGIQPLLAIAPAQVSHGRTPLGLHRECFGSRQTDATLSESLTSAARDKAEADSQPAQLKAAPEAASQQDDDADDDWEALADALPEVASPPQAPPTVPAETTSSSSSSCLPSDIPDLMCSVGMLGPTDKAALPPVAQAHDGKAAGARVLAISRACLQHLMPATEYSSNLFCIASHVILVSAITRHERINEHALLGIVAALCEEVSRHAPRLAVTDDQRVILVRLPPVPSVPVKPTSGAQAS